MPLNAMKMRHCLQFPHGVQTVLHAPLQFAGDRRRQTRCAAYKITVLPGDGIGPEIAKVAVRLLKAAGETCGEDFSFEEQLIGGAAM